jgi:hypothetical protein
MRKREHLDLDDDYDDDITDTTDEVPPGGVVRVPVYLTDTMPIADADLRNHQPGYRMSDAASKSRNFRDLDTLRDAARRERSRWIAKMVDAWKTGPRDVAGGAGQNRTDPRQINRAALSHEPDNSSSLAEWREHMRGPDDEPDHDIDAVMRRHQRQRDDAWARYRDDLHWQRGGNTDPKEADRIMRQGERWRGGR